MNFKRAAKGKLFAKKCKIKSGMEKTIETVMRLRQELEDAQKQIARLEAAAGRQRLTEDALRRTNETLKALIGASPIAIMHLDSLGHVFLWNKAAERMFGWTEQEVLGGLNPIVPEDRKEEFEGIRQMAMKGPITGLEIRRQKKDGAPIDLSLSTAGIPGPRGDIVSYIAVFEDITGRKKDEQSLKLFRDLMNQSNDAIFVIDPEAALVLDVNDMASASLGYRREELLQMKVIDFEVKIPDMAIWGRNLADLRQKGGHFFEGIQRRKDGTTFPVEVNSRYIRQDARDYILAVVRDVTERNRMEEAISKSEQDWQDVFNTITDMITLHDADFNIIRANKAAEKILGLPCITSTRAKCHRVYHGAERPLEDCPGCRVLMTGEPATISIFEPALNMFLEMQAIPRFDEKKRLTGIIHIVRDITERKRAEQEIESYRSGLEDLVKARTSELSEANEKLKLYSAELEKSNRELEHFAYMASHDLQEPLLAIASYLKLFHRHYKDKLEPATAEFVEGAIDSAIRMQSFIRGLLTYSRIGTHEIELRETDTAKTLDAALQNLALQIEKSGAVVTHDPMPALRTDPSQLPHVFQNLIGNALKFHGEEPPRIHVSARRQTDGRTGKDVWIFSVRDNGIGIRPEEIEHIFEIFHRGGDRHPGAGIGLATCKKIIERLGGRIWVESEAGKGSVFHFELPA